jgi:hypothetical protein
MCTRFRDDCVYQTTDGLHACQGHLAAAQVMYKQGSKHSEVRHRTKVSCSSLNTQYLLHRRLEERPISSLNSGVLLIVLLFVRLDNEITRLAIMLYRLETLHLVGTVEQFEDFNCIFSNLSALFNKTYFLNNNGTEFLCFIHLHQICSFRLPPRCR